MEGGEERRKMDKKRETRRSMLNGGQMAEGLESRTSNQKVAGSIPGRAR